MKPKLISVKPFQETLNKSMCGPAVVKMILDFYKIDKSEAEIATQLNNDLKLGTTAETIKEFLESLDFSVEIKNFSEYEDIQKWLDQGVPVIVDWFTRGRLDYPEDSVSEGHYSIIVGLDDQFIYLQDPEVGRLRKISREEFMYVWFDYNGLRPEKWEDMIIRQIIVIQKP
jgi:ABC-type bacteriocin/lantibiotic exporter with double-glycine peptidase domain